MNHLCLCVEAIWLLKSGGRCKGDYFWAVRTLDCWMSRGWPKTAEGTGITAGRRQRQGQGQRASRGNVGPTFKMASKGESPSFSNNLRLECSLTVCRWCWKVFYLLKSSSECAELETTSGLGLGNLWWFDDCWVAKKQNKTDLVLNLTLWWVNHLTEQKSHFTCGFIKQCLEEPLSAGV